MPYSNFDKKCIELLYEAPPRHSRHCFASSLYHLEKAEVLASMDNEMAIFRAITAEEEAATGLMYCLKELNYNNAKKLKVRDHLTKSAVIPFINVILSNLGATIGNKFGDVVMKIDRESESALLTIGMPLKNCGVDLMVWPQPPLNLYIKSDEKKLSYKKSLSELVAEKGKRDVITYVKELANERNKLLYASPKGIPIVTGSCSDYIDKRRSRVLVLLRAFLLIYPYKEKQPLVQDSLDSFLAMLGSIDYEGFHESN